ncbi:immunoglobulin-binding protein 1-like [Gigantopelta aegis]|uniref:immunoglobulin-binding protein 1-like n=1 Tax=Gigantopelta aegis TaxID=1735272 RepID=UPI001B88DC7C|nr:immunoglobulin-binding protein 1-like [Gigantopelta aegis]
MAEGIEAMGDGPKLSALFEEIWDVYQFIENCQEPLASDGVQGRLRIGIQKVELAIRMVNELELFSKNEDLEEVATNEIKYMILPALLGYLINQKTQEERINIVHKVKIFFNDYLKLIKSYKVVDVKIPETSESNGDVAPPGPSSGAMNLIKMAGNRQAKIKEFMERKEMERRLNELREHVEQEHMDEDLKRDYYTTLLKKWVIIAREELDAVSYEIPILEHREKLKQENKDATPTASDQEVKTKKQGFRPFILTKSMLQKEVFGLGYPSLPTYTLDEFFDQKVKDGTFKVSKSDQGPMSLQERTSNPEQAAKEDEEYDAEKERKIEEDDEDELKKAREMDEYKDDHRRGWGNRMNRL